MTIKLGLIILGSLLIYSGWKNLSVQALIFGDNTVAKGGSGFTQTPSSKTPTTQTPTIAQQVTKNG